LSWLSFHLYTLIAGAETTPNEAACTDQTQDSEASLAGSKVESDSGAFYFFCACFYSEGMLMPTIVVTQAIANNEASPDEGAPGNEGTCIEDVQDNEGSIGRIEIQDDSSTIFCSS